MEHGSTLTRTVQVGGLVGWLVAHCTLQLETSSTTKTNLRCEENNPRSRQSQSVEMISLGLFLIICLSFEAASGASTIIRNPCTWKYHQLSPFDSVRPIPKPHFPDHHYRWRRNRNYLSPRSSVVDQGLRRCYAIHNTVGSEGTPIFDEVYILVSLVLCA